MHITIIGTGFVGVVTAAVYASFGNQVTGLDVDEKKVEALKQGHVPFYEPSLESMLVEQQKQGTLSFTTSYAEAIPSADIIMIAVGTPSDANGQADLKYVHASIDSLAPFIKDQTIVAIKSTVPPGTFPEIEQRISSKTKTKFYLASVPEFLREGTAVADTLNPDRIVIGANEQFVFDTLEELHKPLHAPVIEVAPASAQMAKYTANAYLATRITFINQIADLCEKNHADIEEVVEAIGYDKRIGKHYWYPGFGYGGSCFPKDVSELAAYSRSVGEENNLFNKIHELNKHRIGRLLTQYGDQLKGWKGRKVAVLGLSFKPHTDDMREAPSIKTIAHLLEAGATVTGFDPKAIPVAPVFIPNHPKLSYHESIDAAVKNADVIMALIEWPEIITYDFSKARQSGTEQWFIDSRNQFSPSKVEAWGFNYLGVGR